MIVHLAGDHHADFEGDHDGQRGGPPRLVTIELDCQEGWTGVDMWYDMMSDITSDTSSDVMSDESSYEMSGETSDEGCRPGCRTPERPPGGRTP